MLVCYRIKRLEEKKTDKTETIAHRNDCVQQLFCFFLFRNSRKLPVKVRKIIIIRHQFFIDFIMTRADNYDMRGRVNFFQVADCRARRRFQTDKGG